MHLKTLLLALATSCLVIGCSEDRTSTDSAATAPAPSNATAAEQTSDNLTASCEAITSAEAKPAVDAAIAACAASGSAAAAVNSPECLREDFYRKCVDKRRSGGLEGVKIQ